MRKDLMIVYIKRVHLVLLTLLLSLSGKANNNELVINVANAVEGEIRMSQLFENDIEYVRLETTKDCLLVQASIYVTKQYIIAVNMSSVTGGAYLFDRKTGKFIKEISSRGPGPDEYSFMSLSSNAFNEKYNILFFDDLKQWKGFDIETNKLVIKVKNPAFKRKYAIEKKYRNINNIHILEENVFAGYTNNVTGKCPYKLVLFDREGEIIKEFPNYIFYEKMGMDEPFNEGIFYRYNNSLYFKEEYNDTIFKVTKKELYPHIILDLGSKAKQPPNGELKINSISIAKGSGGWSVSSVKETNKCVFFSGHIDREANDNRDSFFFGYYDKIKNKTYLTNKKIINDIDGFPDIIPQKLNFDGEFSYALNPEVLINYSENNNINKIQYKIDDFFNIREDDNPIVVIAKLKD